MEHQRSAGNRLVRDRNLRALDQATIAPINAASFFILWRLTRPKKRGWAIRTRPKLLPTSDIAHDEPVLRQGWQLSGVQLQTLIRHIVINLIYEISAEHFHLIDRDPLAWTAVVRVVVAAALWNEIKGAFAPVLEPFGEEL